MAPSSGQLADITNCPGSTSNSAQNGAGRIRPFIQTQVTSLTEAEARAFMSRLPEATRRKYLQAAAGKKAPRMASGDVRTCLLPLLAPGGPVSPPAPAAPPPPADAASPRTSLVRDLLGRIGVDYVAAGRQFKDTCELESTLQTKQEEGPDADDAEFLTEAQWEAARVVAATLVAARDDVQLKYDEFAVVLSYVLKRIWKGTGGVCSPIWTRLMDDVIFDLEESTSDPFVWAFVLDMRDKLSKGNLYDLQQVFVKLTEAHYLRHGSVYPRSRHGRCFIAGKRQIDEAIRDLDAHLDRKLPVGSSGDNLVWNINQQRAFELLLDACGLAGEGSSPSSAILACVTGDWARFSANSRQGATFLLYKILDHRVRFPNGELGVSAQDELRSLLAALSLDKESIKQWHVQLGQKEKFSRQVIKNGGWFIHSVTGARVYVQFGDAFDMSSYQKRQAKVSNDDPGAFAALAKAKAAKAGSFCDQFCLWCGKINGHIATPNDVPCAWCLANTDFRREHGTMACYHCPVVDDVNKAMLQNQIDLVRGAFDDGEIPAVYYAQFFGLTRLTEAQRTDLGLRGGTAAQSRLLEAKLDEVFSISNGELGTPRHIETPSGLSTAEKAAHKKKVKAQLQGLGLSVAGSAGACVERLKLRLMEIQAAIVAELTIAHCQQEDTNCSVPLQCVIGCLLHMWKSCSQRPLWLMVRDVQNNPALRKATKEKVIEDLERVVNRALGKVRTAWKFDRDDKGNVKEISGIEIYRLKNLIRLHSDEYIEALRPGLSQQRFDDIRLFMAHFKQLFQWLEFHRNTREMMDEISKFSHTYFCLGVDLWGVDFVTNYSHMLGAGHVRYIQEAGWNLKECEQASTEKFGKILKSIVQNKTNGGALERVAGQPATVTRPADRGLRLWQICRRRAGHRYGWTLEFFKKTFTDPKLVLGLTAGDGDSTDDDSNVSFEDDGSGSGGSADEDRDDTTSCDDEDEDEDDDGDDDDDDDDGPRRKNRKLSGSRPASGVFSPDFGHVGHESQDWAETAIVPVTRQPVGVRVKRLDRAARRSE